MFSSPSSVTSTTLGSCTVSMSHSGLMQPMFTRYLWVHVCVCVCGGGGEGEVCVFVGVCVGGRVRCVCLCV